MSQDKFEEVAMHYADLDKQAETTKKRVIEEHFGCSPRVMSIAWKVIEKNETLPNYAKPMHLIWSLYYLKTNPLLRIAAKFCKTDKATFIKWRDFFIHRLADMDIVSTFLF